MQNLQKKLNYYSYKYYTLQNPIISDQKFDYLMLVLRKLEKKNNDFIQSDSPTQKVGSNLLPFLKSISHITPMLSIKNIFELKDLLNFERKIKHKLALKKNINFCCELKLDGLAVSLLYKKGILIQATTRGNGINGENVTKNARTICNLPLKLNNTNVPPKLEVRGEVVILKKDFAILNNNLSIQGKKTFSNARNAASGSLRIKKTSKTNKRKLMFFAYYCNLFNLENKYNSQFQRLKKLQNLGFSINENYILLNKINKIYKFYNAISSKKNNLNVEIDGIVIKVDNIKYQKKLGNTITYPHWAIAFKFYSKKYITKITSVSFQVGRTGTITPVAHFNPVNIDGAIITKASLYNKNNMLKFNISTGDFAEIKRAGEVIPKITNIIHQSMKLNKKIHFPKICPSCSSDIIDNKSKKISKCTGTLICSSQKQKTLEYFVSKFGLNIFGLGPSIIKKLIQNHLINDISDFFYLTQDNLLKISGIEKKYAKNVIYAIKKSKKVSLHTFLCSLGIPNIARSSALKISSFFLSLKKIKNASIQDFFQIKNIGKKTAKNMFYFFKNNKKLISKLEKVLQIENTLVKFKKFRINFFKNKHIVFTGSFKTMKRQKAVKNVLSFGCKNISNYISKKTNLLICGENCGRKIKQAELFKIKILKEKKFVLICKKYSKINTTSIL
ncbi:NAD-dependent DNA ligase LigA [Buchnera aphidicola]|uniref:NAD-dependent DNA ligase LigA n=1 Tax=Buchnera aphidicola TaxID=9 RepID=UPI0034638793